VPLGTSEALALGLIDGHAGPDTTRFQALVNTQAAELASSDRFTLALGEKRARRARDEAQRPLAHFRSDELARMRMNFYGFDPSYHIARHRFVHRTPHAWTPLHLARHRRAGVSTRLESVSA
jgi:putative two-component system hydrogenase maturation factor HypX/HoxX